MLNSNNRKVPPPTPPRPWPADPGRSRPRSPHLSNPNVVLPASTLCEFPDIVTEDEADELVRAIDGKYYREWTPEGYDRRHRVQRFVGDDGEASMEGVFGWIFDRIVAGVRNETDGPREGTDGLPILHRPLEVVVTEHTLSSCRSLVHTFERNEFCPCQRLRRRRQEEQQGNTDDVDSSCDCYVAQLTLVNDAVQSIERPLRRELECWDLRLPTENHETKMILERNGVVLKRGESLWDWRGRISDIRTKEDCCKEESKVLYTGCSEDAPKILRYDKKKLRWSKSKGARKLGSLGKRCITVSFCGILPPECMTSGVKAVNSSVPPRLETKEIPPLAELLTIIVTTSPIRSHPSTELLEQTFETFTCAGEEFAYGCRKVVVCDGCRILDEVDDEEKKDEMRPPKITRKYSNVAQALRNGIATGEQASNYAEFKRRLRRLCDKASDDASLEEGRRSPFRNSMVVELHERNGYGFALRHALYNCVDTPYVCVVQHDRTFMRPCPVKDVVAAMEGDEKIKYVGMSMRSNLMYHDIFGGKYGRRAADEFKSMILHPPELRIGGNTYGPDSASISMIAPKSEKIRKVLEALRQTYRGSHQCLTHKEQTKGSKMEEGQCQLTLSPTLFWYDNTHIVRTSHYRDFIFHPKYRMVARGGFVEDKVSPCVVRSCERLGLRDGHAKFGCYLLDDHSGSSFTGHLDGGSYLTADLHRSPLPGGEQVCHEGSGAYQH